MWSWLGYDEEPAATEEAAAPAPPSTTPTPTTESEATSSTSTAEQPEAEETGGLWSLFGGGGTTAPPPEEEKQVPAPEPESQGGGGFWSLFGGGTTEPEPQAEAASETAEAKAQEAVASARAPAPQEAAAAPPAKPKRRKKRDSDDEKETAAPPKGKKSVKQKDKAGADTTTAAAGSSSSSGGAGGAGGAGGKITSEEVEAVKARLRKIEEDRAAAAEEKKQQKKKKQEEEKQRREQEKKEKKEAALAALQQQIEETRKAAEELGKRREEALQEKKKKKQEREEQRQQRKREKEKSRSRRSSRGTSGTETGADDASSTSGTESRANTSRSREERRRRAAAAKKERSERRREERLQLEAMIAAAEEGLAETARQLQETIEKQLHEREVLEKQREEQLERERKLEQLAEAAASLASQIPTSPPPPPPPARSPPASAAAPAAVAVSSDGAGPPVSRAADTSAATADTTTSPLATVQLRGATDALAATAAVAVNTSAASEHQQEPTSTKKVQIPAASKKQQGKATMTQKFPSTVDAQKPELAEKKKPPIPTPSILKKPTTATAEETGISDISITAKKYKPPILKQPITSAITKEQPRTATARDTIFSDVSVAGEPTTRAGTSLNANRQQRRPAALTKIAATQLDAEEKNTLSFASKRQLEKAREEEEAAPAPAPAPLAEVAELLSRQEKRTGGKGVETQPELLVLSQVPFSAYQEVGRLMAEKESLLRRLSEAARSHEEIVKKERQQTEKQEKMRIEDMREALASLLQQEQAAYALARIVKEAQRRLLRYAFERMLRLRLAHQSQTEEKEEKKKPTSSSSAEKPQQGKKEIRTTPHPPRVYITAGAAMLLGVVVSRCLRPAFRRLKQLLQGMPSWTASHLLSRPSDRGRSSYSTVHQHQQDLKYLQSLQKVPGLSQRLSWLPQQQDEEEAANAASAAAVTTIPSAVIPHYTAYIPDADEVLLSDERLAAIATISQEADRAAMLSRQNRQQADLLRDEREQIQKLKAGLHIVLSKFVEAEEILAAAGSSQIRRRGRERMRNGSMSEMHRGRKFLLMDRLEALVYAEQRRLWHFPVALPRRSVFQDYYGSLHSPFPAYVAERRGRPVYEEDEDKMAAAEARDEERLEEINRALLKAKLWKEEVRKRQLEDQEQHQYRVLQQQLMEEERLKTIQAAATAAAREIERCTGNSQPRRPVTQPFEREKGEMSKAAGGSIEAQGRIQPRLKAGPTSPAQKVVRWPDTAAAAPYAPTGGSEAAEEKGTSLLQQSSKASTGMPMLGEKSPLTNTVGGQGGCPPITPTGSGAATETTTTPKETLERAETRVVFLDKSAAATKTKTAAALKTKMKSAPLRQGKSIILVGQGPPAGIPKSPGPS